MRFCAILCDLAGFCRNLALRGGLNRLIFAPTQLGKAPVAFDWGNTNPQRHGGAKDAQKSFERRSNFACVRTPGQTGLFGSNANYGGLANFTGFLERELLTVAP